MSDAIIRTGGLTRCFGDFTAVDRLAIEVERGSIYAFLGANGSGKSTTIRMLIGILQPTEGSVVVDGVDVVRRPRRVRDRIGYMGQKVSLHRGLSLRENAEFYGGLYGLSDAELERRWGELGERFGLETSSREDVAELPAGIRQRAGLALATLHRPRLLFLDEPTAGVDVRSRGLFWDAIQEQADAGVTVFVTTHFMEEAEYCDRVSFIDRGRLIADADPETLRRHYSAGYRVRIDLVANRRPLAIDRLGRFGAVDETDAGVVVNVPSIDPELLGEVKQLAGDVAPNIEVAPMTGVFREILVREGVS